MEDINRLLQSVRNYFENPRNKRSDLVELISTTFENIMEKKYQQKHLRDELVTTFKSLSGVFQEWNVSEITLEEFIQCYNCCLIRKNIATVEKIEYFTPSPPKEFSIF